MLFSSFGLSRRYVLTIVAEDELMRHQDELSLIERVWSSALDWQTEARDEIEGIADFHVARLACPGARHAGGPPVAIDAGPRWRAAGRIRGPGGGDHRAGTRDIWFGRS